MSDRDELVRLDDAGELAAHLADSGDVPAKRRKHAPQRARVASFRFERQAKEESER